MDSLYNYISSHPGQSYSVIDGIFHYPTGTLRYYLDTLERSGKIRKDMHSGRAYYYKAGTTVPGYDGPPLTESERRVWETVASNPGVSQKGLMVLTRSSRMSLKYRLNKMIEKEVIYRRKEGRHVAYYHMQPEEMAYLSELKVIMNAFLDGELTESQYRRKKRRLRGKFGI